MKKLQGEFECTELAELAAGRIRRSVQGIHRTVIRQSGNAVPQPEGHLHYTMLPANMRMQNYATAVMESEISDAAFPEPMYRRTAKLTILCDAESLHRAEAVMQAMGAIKIQKN